MRDFQQRVLDAPRASRATLQAARRRRSARRSALPDLFDEDRPTDAERQVEDGPRRGAAVLLSGGARAQLERRAARHGATRVRDPGDAARRAEGADRRHPRPDRSAGSGQDPPAGVEAEVAGLPVLAAEANEALSGSRYWLTAAGLLAVAAALIAVYRSPRRALVPLIPIVLATGWSALVVAAIGIPLNPMSATLGALVIAIATEFSVMLSARYGQEREVGHSVWEALRRTYARTGAAVAGIGRDAIAGFAALIALRDQDAARLRVRDRRRPRRRPAGGDDRPPGDAGVGGGRIPALLALGGRARRRVGDLWPARAARR